MALKLLKEANSITTKDNWLRVMYLYDENYLPYMQQLEEISPLLPPTPSSLSSVSSLSSLVVIDDHQFYHYNSDDDYDDDDDDQHHHYHHDEDDDQKQQYQHYHHNDAKEDDDDDDDDSALLYNKNSLFIDGRIYMEYPMAVHVWHSMNFELHLRNFIEEHIIYELNQYHFGEYSTTCWDLNLLVYNLNTMSASFRLNQIVNDYVSESLQYLVQIHGCRITVESYNGVNL